MKKTENSNKELTTFPVSSTKLVKGHRRLVREKVLQILVAHFISEYPLDEVFDTIFHRYYNVENEEEEEKNTPNTSHRFLTEEEIVEIESDSGIEWRSEDIKLAKIIINGALEENNFVEEKLKEISKNWRYERISIIDRVLILIAVSEFLHCPSIPVKVSINEVVDIAKIYSTDKSTQFINGILDTLLTFLTKENKINKTGRGLK